MAVQILMPALSPTMTEGKLATWHVKEGDTVQSGDVIAEIETDKATMEVEAVDEGTVGQILIPAGTDGVAVNSLIAVLLEEGEGADQLNAALQQQSTPAPQQPSQDSPSVPPASEPVSSVSQAPSASAVPPTSTGGRLFASPLARRLAKEKGLDLASISGSGPRGRILKRDIEQAEQRPSGSTQGSAAPVSSAVSKAASAVPSGPSAKTLADQLGLEYELLPHTKMREVIAQRLSESKQTVPHFYLSIDCEIESLLALRKTLNTREADKKSGVKISVNDFVIRASALALQKVPQANASWSDEGMVRYKNVDLSVAVAVEDGLLTPVIKNANHKGLAALSVEMKDLAKRAREGKLMPQEYQGGNFSISNLGMFGIKSFSAIINPPQGAILSVGAGEQRPVIKDGELKIATVMTVSLSCDHRVIDGAVGAQFLAAFKPLIEDPTNMLL